MLSRVRIRNYKCLRDVDVRLDPLTVFIGKNDTGKTSLLESLFTLGRLVRNDLEGFKGPWALSRRVTIDDVGRPVGDLEWDVTIEPTERNRLPAACTYELSIRFDDELPEGRLVREACTVGDVASFRMTDDGPHFTIVGQHLEHQLPPSHFSSRTAPILRDLSHDRYPLFKSVSNALTSTMLYRLDPKQLSSPSPLGIDERGQPETPHLRHDGYGLASVLDHLLGGNRRAFDEIQANLAQATPGVRAVLLRSALIPRINRESLPGKTLAFETIGSDHEVQGNMVSDGVLLMLAYLTLVHSPSAPSAVLLEEPENGIHPRQLARVVKFLRMLTLESRGTSRAQVLLSTHSPYLLDHVGPEEVRVFGRDPHGRTIVREMLELPKVESRLEAGFSIGELWYNSGEDELLNNSLLTPPDAPTAGK